MLAPVAHILPLTTLRRERLLPFAGRVVARVDQKVGSTDVVAEGRLGREHILLDVARLLGISAEAAKPLIVVKDGDQIAAGQVIAQKKGFSPVTVKAPRDGRVVLVGGGQVLLEVGEETIELRAGMPGVVTKIVQERGVEIKFCGALVEGVWGNGRLDMGVMHSLLNTPADGMSASQLDVSLRGLIILGGHVADAAVLQNAAEIPVRGLIVSSLMPSLIPLAEQMPLPIVVVDGFGRRPMNSAAFKLLTTNAKRETTLNAEPYDLHRGTRPAVLIPLPVSQEPPTPRQVETFAPGQQVRLCRAPHEGEIGSLVTLRPGLTALPSGLRLPVAEIRLESGEQIVVPLANLEVLG